MKQAKTKSSVYEYLDSLKVLETGTEHYIAQARDAYWRAYKAQWRKAKRKSEKEICTSWSSDELKDLTKEAQRHKTSRTKFIKKCTIAYMNKAYIVPDQLEIRKIAQLLAMNYNSIREMTDENNLPLQAGKIVLEKILQLEREVLVSLHNPKTIDQLVSEEICKNPLAKLRLTQVLETITCHGS